MYKLGPIKLWKRNTTVRLKCVFDRFVKTIFWNCSMNLKDSNSAVYCYTQGVPINMGIERRLIYCLWFPINDKWHKMHQKLISSLLSFPKCGLPFFGIFKIYGDFMFWSVLLIFEKLESEQISQYLCQF